MVARSESRLACAPWRRGAVPAAFAFCAFLLPAALLDLGEAIGGGIKLAQVTGAVLVVTEAMLPLLLVVTFDQVGEVGSLCGPELRDPVFAFFFLPAQEGIRRFFAFARVFGRSLRIEFSLIASMKLAMPSFVG